MRKILLAVMLGLLSTAAVANEQGYGYVPVAHFGESTAKGGTLDVELMRNEVKNCWGKPSRIGMMYVNEPATRSVALTGCWRVDAIDESVVMIIQDPISMETTMLTLPIDKFNTKDGFPGWTNP